MYLANELLQQPQRAPPFKVAILMACVAVYDPTAWYTGGQVSTLDAAVHGQVMSIPTAHIWGEKDTRKAESKELYELSKEGSRFLFVHAGDHEVPGARIPGALSGAVQTIRRAVAIADTRK